MRELAIILTGVVFTAVSACDAQRDLYVDVPPTIYIEGDWVPAIQKPDMSMNATAVAYHHGAYHAKEYFLAPDNVTIPVRKGAMDLVIFNGLMYDADDTHLDGVFFRGIDRLDTFEAVAMETPPIRRLSRAEGEYIATNNMEIFTSMASDEEVEAEGGHFLKYRDGVNQGNIPQGIVHTEHYLTPVAMSYEAQIVVEVTNISSAYGANAALRGFAGSAFVAQRRPSHFLVTHQFNLNNKRMTDSKADVGTIESPVFVTFGPPVDMPGNVCELYVRIALVDGGTFEQTFDVTDHLATFIESIKNNIEGTLPVQNSLSLTIPISLELPDVDPVDGAIGIGDWDDDEIITVPIKA